MVIAIQALNAQSTKQFEYLTPYMYMRKELDKPMNYPLMDMINFYEGGLNKWAGPKE